MPIGTVFSLGNLRDPLEMVCSDKRLFPWLSVSNASIPPYLVQDYAWIQDQKSMPSCVGQAISACINASEKKKDKPRWASATSIWKDARRRDGNLQRMVGTSLGIGVHESVFYRGISPYREGENEDAAGALEPDCLDSELDASDRVVPEAKRYRITNLSKAPEVAQALAQGKYVVFGSIVSQIYMDHRMDRPNRVFNEHEIGCSNGLGGHAQRICGYRVAYGAYEFLVQNSWGEGWGGALLQDGKVRPGCAWVDEGVLDSPYSWDFHVLDLG